MFLRHEPNAPDRRGDDRPRPLEQQLDTLAATLTRPAVVCVDDAHELSADALAVLSGLPSRAPVRVLLVSRTLLELPGAVTYRLAGLDHAQGSRLIAELDPGLDPELGPGVRAARALLRGDVDLVHAIADEMADWVTATGFALYADTPHRLRDLAGTTPNPVDLPRLLWTVST